MFLRTLFKDNKPGRLLKINYKSSKLECLSIESTTAQIDSFLMECSLLRVRLLALPTNVRLGWSPFSEANTLAYFAYYGRKNTLLKPWQITTDLESYSEVLLWYPKWGMTFGKFSLFNDAVVHIISFLYKMKMGKNGGGGNNQRGRERVREAD